MAATATKPQLLSLKTPVSAIYPSEIQSPLVSTPTYIKREDKEGLKTPVTPPPAYLDFLAKLSPALPTPPGSGSGSFYFPAKPILPTTSSADSVATVATIASSASVPTTAGPVPSESSNPTSPRSHKSSRSSSCSSFTGEAAKPAETRVTQITIPPPSPFSAPGSAPTPRRLLIPQSPYSPGSMRSPLSATTLYSPIGALSPRDMDPDSAANSKRAVSIRQIVTRTVTFARQPAPKVDPVPASKKRKLESNEGIENRS